ncbi:TPA: MFS transporter [Klebsiella variicola subsp. variicola]
MHGWTSRQRNAAIASFLSWTLDAFDFFLLVFLLSDIAHSFHVDLEEVTLAILLTLAVRPIGALIFGRAAEKYGRKPILMLNIVFFSAFELLSAAAPSLLLFFLLRVLYGVAMGGIWGVASSLAMETIPDRSRGLMSGLFQAGYPFGYLLAAVAYGLLFEQLGWRGMFVIGAAPVLLLPFIYFCVEESPVWLAARQSKASTALLPVLRSHWKLCLYLVVLPGFVYQLGNLLASVNATLQASIAQHHGHNYGLAMALVAGTVAIVITVLTFFGREGRVIQPAGAGHRQPLSTSR